MILKWLLIGLIAGTLAKMITPQDEGDSWLSSLGIGVLGSIAGGFMLGLLGFHTNGLLGELISAVIGSVVLLFLYHRYKT